MTYHFHNPQRLSQDPYGLSFPAIDSEDQVSQNLSSLPTNSQHNHITTTQYKRTNQYSTFE